MPVSQNSISTYNEHVKPFLSSSQKEVYEVVKKHHPTGITIYETAIELGVFPNQISGRFGELVGKSLIIMDGYRKIPTSRNPRTNHGVWILTEEGTQLKLFK